MTPVATRRCCFPSVGLLLPPSTTNGTSYHASSTSRLTHSLGLTGALHSGTMDEPGSAALHRSTQHHRLAVFSVWG
eukprot:7992982-Prorocentrum_lima.AAC.1